MLCPSRAVGSCAQKGRATSTAESVGGVQRQMNTSAFAACNCNACISSTGDSIIRADQNRYFARQLYWAVNCLRFCKDNYTQDSLASFSVKKIFLTGFPLSGTIPRFAAIVWLRLLWLLCLIVLQRSTNTAGCLNWSFPRQGHLVLCGRHSSCIWWFSHACSPCMDSIPSALISCWNFFYYVFSASLGKQLVGKFQLEHFVLGFIKAKLFRNYGFSDM